MGVVLSRQPMMVTSTVERELGLHIVTAYKTGSIVVSSVHLG